MSRGGTIGCLANTLQAAAYIIAPYRPLRNIGKLFDSVKSHSHRCMHNKPSSSRLTSRCSVASLRAIARSCCFVCRCSADHNLRPCEAQPENAFTHLSQKTHLHTYHSGVLKKHNSAKNAHCTLVCSVHLHWKFSHCTLVCSVKRNCAVCSVPKKHNST